MNCEFCENLLSNKYTLSFHQKNNKKCLEIQKIKLKSNVNSSLQNCEFCNKNFISSNLKIHLISCKVKKKIDNENIEKINLEKEKEYENKILELEKINLEQQIKISELQVELQTYKNIYEKDHQVISIMAQQPKTTTNSNTNNIVNNLAVYDNKAIADRFTDVLSNIKPSDLYDGQESISRYIAPCLKNDDGTQMYKCTDYSRGVYIKKDHHGNIIKDINSKNLVELIEPIASKKAVELLEEDNNKKDKQRRLRYLKKYIETQYDEIENVRNHMKGYEINSSSGNVRIKMLENSINKHMEEQEELENEGIDELDDEVCDDKLTDGVNDIKNMKKDSSKFSKKLSKILD